jgi:hypothetical protein
MASTLEYMKMSNAIDYEAQPGVPPLTNEQAQKAAEDMIASGIDIETVNAHLESIGVEPLDISPSVTASRQLAALKADPAWVAKLNRGDPEANADFNTLAFVISQGSTEVERPPAASDYYRTFKPHPIVTDTLRQVDGEKAVDQFHKEHSEWYASLAMSPQAAGAITDMLLDGTQRFNAMDEDQRINFAEAQKITFSRILAKEGDPDARIKAAETVLTQRGGRPIDLNRICRQVGVDLALELVLQAERLQRS